MDGWEEGKKGKGKGKSKRGMGCLGLVSPDQQSQRMEYVVWPRSSVYTIQEVGSEYVVTKVRGEGSGS